MTTTTSPWVEDAPMGSTQSQPTDTDDSAHPAEAPSRVAKDTLKRRLEDPDSDWPAKDLEEALEQREKRRKLKEFRLSPQGDESSEFESEDDDGGVAVAEGEMSEAVAEDKISSGAPEEAAVVAAPATEYVVARMNREAEEYVAKLLKGHTFRPISETLKSRQQQVSESGNEDGNMHVVNAEGNKAEEEEEEEEEEESEDEPHAGGGTQVVQDSMDVYGGDVPSADRDSGHGSMEESEVESSADEQVLETAPESAQESPVTGSPSLLSPAVHETIRRVQSERGIGTGAGSSEAETDEESGKENTQPAVVQLTSDTDAIEARKRFVAERKAKKKERIALARQQRKAIAATDTDVATAIAVKKSVLRTVPLMPRQHKGQTFKAKLHTRSEKRAIKRAKYAEKMQRAAHEDPETQLQVLRSRIIVEVPELGEDAGDAARREHKRAMKKLRRAKANVQQFEELVAKSKQEEGSIDPL